MTSSFWVVIALCLQLAAFTAHSESVQAGNEVGVAKVTEEAPVGKGADDKEPESKIEAVSENTLTITDYSSVSEAMVALSEIGRSMDLPQTGSDELDALIRLKKKLLDQVYADMGEKEAPVNASLYGEMDKSFLLLRIKTNDSRGNDYAVARDESMLVEQDLIGRINRFNVFFYKAISDGIPKDIILNRISLEQKGLDELLGRLPSITKKADETAIYTQAQGVYSYALAQIRAWSSLLGYIALQEASLASQSVVMQLLDYEELIKEINGQIPLTPKYYLDGLNIDVGRTVVSGLIFIIALLFIPIIFKYIDYISNNHVKSEVSKTFYTDNKKWLSRSIRYIVILFGLSIFFKDQGYIKFTEESLFVLITLVGVAVSLKSIDFFFVLKAHSSRKDALRKEVVNLGMKFTKMVVVIVFSVIALNHYGISVAAILSALGIGGLAFALAAKDTLSNFFGGLNIFFDDVFKQGDWIDVNGVEGDVVEIGLRSTTLRTFDNALVSVPNSEISIQRVKNWSRRKVGRRIKFWLPVAIDSSSKDLQKALSEIRDYLLKSDEISGDQHTANMDELYLSKNKLLSARNYNGIKDTQLVYLDRVGTYSLDILIYCFSHTTNWSQWLGVKENLIFDILIILEDNNINFAYPTQHYQTSKDRGNGEAIIHEDQ